MDAQEEYYRLIRTVKDYILLEMAYGGDFVVLENKPTSNEQKNLVQIENEPAGEQKNLAQIEQVALTCTSCKLAQTRTQVVFGSGPANAQLVVVGEAPGYYEDQQGIPFVGKAGQLLTRMLAGIRLKREEVYICNVIKCRPPNNRDPLPDEITACQGWLQTQLKLLSPKLICAMGRFAAHFLSGIQQSMWKYRGNTYEYQGIPVICTYHPSYLLRNENDKKKAWEDLKRIRKFLDE